jgi:site-specific DNA recombinase
MTTRDEFAIARLADLEDRAGRLSSRLAEIRQQVAAIEGEGAAPMDVEAAIHAFDPLWEQLSTWEQERFIRALVNQIRYDGKTGTVTLGFRSSGIKELCDWAPAITEKYEHAQQRS